MNLFILFVLNFYIILSQFLPLKRKENFHVPFVLRDIFPIFYWLLHDDTQNVTNNIKWTVAIETFLIPLLFILLSIFNSNGDEMEWKKRKKKIHSEWRKRRSRICGSKANIGINLFSHICEWHERQKEREMTIVRNYLYHKASTNHDFYFDMH